MAMTKLHSASSHKRTLRAGPFRNNVSKEYELQLVYSNRAVVMTDIVEKIDLLPLKIGLKSLRVCMVQSYLVVWSALYTGHIFFFFSAVIV